MNPENIRFLRCPRTQGKLTLAPGARLAKGQILKGVLRSERGETYPIREGVPVLWQPEQGRTEIVQKTLQYYRETAPKYDEYLPVAFRLFFGNESKLRQRAVELLRPRPGDRVLDLTAGTGKDSLLLSGQIRRGQLWCMDLCGEMLRKARNRLRSVRVSQEFVEADGGALPFASGMFDAVYSFTGLSTFASASRAMAEIARVARPGGRVVVVEKCVPPWMEGTEFSRILREANPLYDKKIPLEYLPATARDVRLEWGMEGTLYFLSFEVSGRPPRGNFHLELPGPRGGSFWTRYHGKLEGVTEPTKKLAWEAARRARKSLHRWLDEVVATSARRHLNKNKRKKRR